MIKNLLWAVWIILFLEAGANCCNVPVFRYALERWAADPYQILVYQDGPLDPVARKACELLYKASFTADAMANLVVRSIDVTTEEGKNVLKQGNVPEFPWIEIHFPATSRIENAVWSGPLTIETAERLLRSPARSKLAERLLQGDAGVWILLECGDVRLDNQAADLLQTELAHLSSQLKIPQTGVDANRNVIQADDFKDYKVRFSMIRITRSDPDEELFVKMLLGSEPDLIYYDAPMVFPVFGRGRALYALVGNGINQKLVSETCRSLINWCSCEIKALNPGIDLLVSADWSSPDGGKMVKTDLPPALTGLSNFVENNQNVIDEESISEHTRDDTVRTKTETLYEPVQDSNYSIDTLAVPEPEMRPLQLITRNLIILIILGLSFVIGFTFLIIRRKSKD